MKKIAVFFLGVIYSFSALAQTTISGQVTDFNTGEALIGAAVI